MNLCTIYRRGTIMRDKIDAAFCYFEQREKRRPERTAMSTEDGNKLFRDAFRGTSTVERMSYAYTSMDGKVDEHWTHKKERDGNVVFDKRGVGTPQNFFMRDAPTHYIHDK